MRGGRVVMPEPVGIVRRDAGSIRWYGQHVGNVASLDLAESREVAAVMECNWAWRTSILRSLEFDPALDNDDASMYGLDLCLQAETLGYSVVYEPRARVLHHAAPREERLNRKNRAHRSFSYARNYTYIGLKHFNGMRGVSFRFWWWWIGERGAYAAVAALTDILMRRPDVLTRWKAAMRGRRGGIALAHPVKVLLVATHPVQYAAPLYQLYAKDPRIDLRVAYCSLQGAEAGRDPDFDMDFSWDIPLLDGYRWLHRAPNRSPVPRSRGFLSLINPGLWGLIRTGGFDIVVCYGYRTALVLDCCDRCQVFRLRSGFHDGRPLLGCPRRIDVERDLSAWLCHHIFSFGDAVLAPSSATSAHLRRMGVDEQRIFLTPYVVDNQFFERPESGSRLRLRRSWGVPDDAPVALCVAKLVSWKRPQDLLKAAARVEGLHVVLAGSGGLRAELEALAGEEDLCSRVHFLGFVNQGQLPAIYAASDFLVLPSEYEPFGLVVNEAFASARTAVVSDACGSVGDLVKDGETGYVVPVGDLEALILRLKTLAWDDELERLFRKTAISCGGVVSGIKR